MALDDKYISMKNEPALEFKKFAFTAAYPFFSAALKKSVELGRQ